MTNDEMLALYEGRKVAFVDSRTPLRDEDVRFHFTGPGRRLVGASILGRHQVDLENGHVIHTTVLDRGAVA